MRVTVRITLDVSPNIERLKDRVSGERIAGIEKSVREHIYTTLSQELECRVSQKIEILNWKVEEH